MEEWVTKFNVDLSELQILATSLRDAAAEGAPLTTRRGRLADLATGADPAFASAAGRFLDSWSWGCEQLVADAELLSGLVQQAEAGYRFTEEAVVEQILW